MVVNYQTGSLQLITNSKLSVLLNTAKNIREHETTRDPFAITVRVRAAYLSSVIA